MALSWNSRVVGSHFATLDIDNLLHGEIMYPFEVWNEEQQRIDFHFDRFSEFKEQLFLQYPINHQHHRVQISLIFPSDRLEDVWVNEWNPHHEMGNHHLSVYDCFYDSDRWSTIFEVYPAHAHDPHQESWICFVEEDHADPRGEPIRLMSTADVIYNDTAHRYAYFRGRYWKILMWLPHFPAVHWIGDSPLQWTILGYRWSSTREEMPKHNWMKEGF